MQRVDAGSAPATASVPTWPDRAAAPAFEWSIAVSAARETPETLWATIAAAAAAAAGSGARLDVLVNGNPSLAAAAARDAARAPESWRAATALRIWDIALGDKAHAWNEYLHRIRPDCELAFFIDGYARLQPDALRQLAQALRAQPAALGATGTPSVGRSAAQARRAMTVEGGIQGNCFCIRQAVLDELARLRFRLPVGLYRVDGLLGAVLAYRLDPARHAWDLRGAIAVEPAATWMLDEKRWWRLADLRATLRRRARQAQGELENLALRDHLSIRRRPPQELPATAAELVLDWLARRPDAAATVGRSRRLARALAALREPRDWSAAAQRAPVLLWDGAAAAATTAR